jgi:hypothetical protein
MCDAYSNKLRQSIQHSNYMLIFFIKNYCKILKLQGKLHLKREIKGQLIKLQMCSAYSNKLFQNIHK